MRNGACTEPGIQSRENRIFVSARAWFAATTVAAATRAAIKADMCRRADPLPGNGEIGCIQYSPLKFYAGRFQQGSCACALLVGDGQAFGEIAPGRAGGIDSHLGERKGLRVRGGIENRSLRARDEDDVL